jgi:hypothetical protein
METEALPRQARDKRDGNTFAKNEGVSHTHRVDGNTIFKSWGAGIMVFGHQTTSHNLSISNNTFIQAGCIQTRGEKRMFSPYYFFHFS